MLFFANDNKYHNDNKYMHLVYMFTPILKSICFINVISVSNYISIVFYL